MPLSLPLWPWHLLEFLTGTGWLKQRSRSEGKLVHSPPGTPPAVLLPPPNWTVSSASKSETGPSSGNCAVSTFPPHGPISRAQVGVTWQ